MQICKQNYPFSRGIAISKSNYSFYSKHITIRMIALVFPPLTWHIFQIIVDALSLDMFICVFNQSKGHWVLSDALNSTIFTCLKFKEEFEISSYFDILWKRSSLLLLSQVFWPLSSKKRFLLLLDFLIYLKKYEKKEVHNMFFLMLNLRFKNLHLVSSFIGFEQKKAILEKYDIPCYLKMPLLIKMLMKIAV